MGRGARNLPLYYEGAWDTTLTYLPRQVVTLAGSPYMALAKNIGVSPDSDPTVWLPFGGGGQVPSRTPLAYVSTFDAPTITAGTQWGIDWSTATIVKGAAWWGVSGSALDLNVDNNSGALAYPAGEGVYDVTFHATIATPTAGDAGKMVGLGFRGNITRDPIFGGYRQLKWNPSVSLYMANCTFQAHDFVFVNNTTALHTYFSTFVDASYVSSDVSASSLWVLVTRRA